MTLEQGQLSICFLQAFEKLLLLAKVESKLESKTPLFLGNKYLCQARLHGG